MHNHKINQQPLQGDNAVLSTAEGKLFGVKQGKNGKVTAGERLRDARTQSSAKQKQNGSPEEEMKDSGLMLTAAASPAVKTQFK